jgi:hypothetical protein
MGRGPPFLQAAASESVVVSVVVALKKKIRVGSLPAMWAINFHRVTPHPKHRHFAPTTTAISISIDWFWRFLAGAPRTSSLS